jgi:predicted nucleic acid-binding protein
LTLLVDTSVWSLALRRDAESSEVEVQHLKEALLGADVVVTTGLVLQELLQGFSGPKASARIVERFAAFPLVQSTREDHGAAAQHVSEAWNPGRHDRCADRAALHSS